MNLVAIIGRPNVGKSTLFNRLIGRRQAITFEEAGTTRDANYGRVEWNGRAFTLVDTAGLARADGEIELQAQDQVRQVADLAQVLVLVVDAGTIITGEDQEAVRLARKSGHPVILVLGKYDAARGVSVDEFRRLGIEEIIPVSAIHGQGTGNLLDAIVERLPEAEPEREPDAPLRLALLGRPNVGKSSILNAIVGKQQAVVSATAGTTRDVGSAFVTYHGRRIELLDTAGLRRRGKIEHGAIEQYSALRTLATIQEADVCAVIIDAEEPSVANDQHIAGMVLDAGKGLILVVNKWDVIEKDEKTQDKMARRLQKDFQFAWWAPLIFTSAVQGLHVNKLMELSTQIDERRRTELPTGPFNRLIQGLVAKQPPAGLKNRQPKINYATQTGTNPPTFTIFSSYPEMVHFSYRRYLENGLRAEHDFTGTPIKLIFKGKREENPKGRRRG